MKRRLFRFHSTPVSHPLKPAQLGKRYELPEEVRARMPGVLDDSPHVPDMQLPVTDPDRRFKNYIVGNIKAQKRDKPTHSVQRNKLIVWLVFGLLLLFAIIYQVAR